jgi:nitrate reductase molybdenum cofactor assembly chaperone
MSGVDTTVRTLLDQVGVVLGYPGHACATRVATAKALADHAAELLDGADAGKRLAAAAAALAEDLDVRGPDWAAERYTVLFDMSPVCTLAVGYHVFGETYARGEFLAGLVGELREHGVSMGEELPDHLPVLLQLLGRMQDAEDRRLLLSVVLLPGLDKMLSELETANDPWSKVLRALPDVLKESFPDEVSLPDDLVALHDPSIPGGEFIGQEVATHA